ncbi:MAG: hypothetical protein V4543_18255 [Bacteroidota bacterium]
MKTTQYNPSKIETDFCEALQGMATELAAHLPDYSITGLTPTNNRDNPFLVVALTDKDGDKHELVISFVQRPDR